MNTSLSLPDRLKQARGLLNLTQSQAAEQSGVHQPHISDMEKNEKKLIPIRYFTFLHERGIDVNSLFEEGPVRLRGEAAPVLSDGDDRIGRLEQEMMRIVPIIEDLHALARRKQLSPAAASDNGVGATKRDAGK